MAEGPALEKRYPVCPGSWVRIPPSPPFPINLGKGRGSRATFEKDNDTWIPKTERCPSWLKEHDWKSCVSFIAAPRVRIPLSPPHFVLTSCLFLAHKWLLSLSLGRCPLHIVAPLVQVRYKCGQLDGQGKRR